jgi:hypothetical protein
MRLNKSIKILINYFLGPLLFIWLAVSIYRQIINQPGLEQSWLHIQTSLTSSKIWLLAGVILLMLGNWSIEAVKWKLSVSAIHPVGFVQSFKAILSGVSFSVTLPNRIGEYAGRLLFLPDGKRLKAVANTVGGSISQLLVTLLSGLAGFAVLKGDLLKGGLFTNGWHQLVFTVIGIVTFVLTVLYFCMAPIGRWVAQKWPNSRHLHLVRPLQTFSVQLLMLLLLLSLLRYGVFVVQYFLLFSLFEVHATATVVWSVLSVVFLTLAIIPNIALVEVGLRGKVSLQLMALFTANSLGVLLATVSIWFVNLIVPALAGSVLILSIKVFKRKNETIEI